MFKNGILCWRYCPSCDGKLVAPTGVGDDWECAECGEEGTRAPGKYDVTLAAVRQRQAELINKHRIEITKDGWDARRSKTFVDSLPF